MKVRSLGLWIDFEKEFQQLPFGFKNTETLSNTPNQNNKHRSNIMTIIFKEVKDIDTQAIQELFHWLTGNQEISQKILDKQ